MNAYALFIRGFWVLSQAPINDDSAAFNDAVGVSLIYSLASGLSIRNNSCCGVSTFTSASRSWAADWLYIKPCHRFGRMRSLLIGGEDCSGYQDRRHRSRGKSSHSDANHAPMRQKPGLLFRSRSNLRIITLVRRPGCCFSFRGRQ